MTRPRRVLDGNGDPVTLAEAEPGPCHVPDGCEWCVAADVSLMAARAGIKVTDALRALRRGQSR